ncbi:hypothetical protein PBI_SMARTIES_98 [Microbacterium phage Smarties]|uniref:Uncharacterized protein n=1 Tax=Microbacterium phage Ariadne TaxID=2656546 RepID=A0A649VAW7_9CAUD|nr:hypothetical protein QDA10_gp098 [Microbacterium phage Ariadne]QGJ89501.1 hypothetical protein PBI_ARIADNE_98 [Microbacterium phage Ariadne]QGJ91488.1 hypothetical protein PBI_SMARTIES_98 [Microbacterium phage Smarties]
MSAAIVLAIADEVAKHVDLFLFEDMDDAGGKRRRDTGGLTCSCGQWSAPAGPPPQMFRPRAEFDLHRARAIQRALQTESVIETLNAVNQRITVQRLGKSLTREMDRDILVLRKAAAALIDLIGDDTDA